MSAKKLPWETVPGKKYKARELRPRKRWVTVGSWVLAACLFVAGFVTPYWILIIFAVLYGLALLMDKQVAVTERGLEMYYQMKVTQHYELVKWQDMVSLIYEDKKHPELVALYFGLPGKAKRVYFTREDAKAIMALAKRKNPSLIVDDAKNTPVPRYKVKK